MPTMGDLLQWAVKTFGEGVLHKNAQATRGGDYLQKGQMQQSQMMDAATRRAIQLGQIEQARLKTGATAAQGRAEFPELEGAGDEEAAARLELMRGAKDREVAEALKLAQVDTEMAQQEELGKRHSPKPMNESDLLLADLQAEKLRSEAEENEAQARLADRRPGVTPPRVTPPKQATGLDVARLRLQADRAGLTPEEIEELVAEVQTGKPTAPAAPATAPTAPAASGRTEVETRQQLDALPEVETRQQFDALPVGSRFTRGGRLCVKVSASQMDCK